MPLKKSPSAPQLQPSWWRKYHYYSDSSCEPRIDICLKNLMKFDKDLVDRKKKNPNDPMLHIVDDCYIKPSKIISGSGWDKYYFFSDLNDKKFLTMVSRLGRKRVASEGPATFSPDFVEKNTPPLDPNMRLAATSYDEAFTKHPLARTTKLEPSLRPHIFPDGHKTVDILFSQECERPHPKTTTCFW